MFTGLVETTGTLTWRKSPQGADLRPATIQTTATQTDALAIGDSLAVDGVCLTVTKKRKNAVDVDIGPETLRATTLGGLEDGAKVHLERALQAGAPMGGHLVTGHVDTVGKVTRRRPSEDGQTVEFVFSVPKNFGMHLVAKGSVTIDGVSLTVNRVTDGKNKTKFSVLLIPHTLDVTKLGELRKGDGINIETDLFAKFFERQVVGLKDRFNGTT